LEIVPQTGIWPDWLTLFAASDLAQQFPVV
jgi:hypothetical protein